MEYQVLADVFNRKEIYSYFSRSATEKAYVYQAQGRVKAVDVSNDLTRITSRVRGSGSEEYRVDIQLEFDDGSLSDLGGDCTCLVGFNCKHVAATLLEAGIPSALTESDVNALFDA